MHPLSPASFVCCIRPVLYAYEGPISLCKNKYFVLYSIALYSKDNSRSTGISVRLVPILFARFMPFFQTFSLPFQTLNVSRIPMKLGPAGVRNANVGPPPPPWISTDEGTSEIYPELHLLNKFRGHFFYANLLQPVW